MGTTHRFLAIGDDIQRIYDWFAALPEPPEVIQARGCQYLYFANLGGLSHVPGGDKIDAKRSPIASLFLPAHLNGMVWTAGELHFLPTPFRELFPKLHSISRQFSKWLCGFDCVFKRPYVGGEWNFFLEGMLQNFDTPIFALPNAMKALREGQYFVSDGFTGEALRRLCRTLELRGVVAKPAEE